MSEPIHIAGYELIEPTEPCRSPDGHEQTVHRVMASHTPVYAVCSRCGQYWTIVLFQHETSRVRIYKDE
jgi:uncharacterized Zn finger protein